MRPLSPGGALVGLSGRSTTVGRGKVSGAEGPVSGAEGPQWGIQVRVCWLWAQGSAARRQRSGGKPHGNCRKALTHCASGRFVVGGSDEQQTTSA
eukprot:CAMPEP_0171096968 /NCGR_PEP_ID=MMETSP0766_2-20121228/46462_1 /TAXON_ID=439317 /ORGANISM="Gambierdiscus australes, Strain CAWD 149" /LENGTH=94 /DNA_ID=CAMNT_0011556065 /DNA_START=164 /DNA_END=445 /DNA_ORIENTATION=+